MAQVHLPQQLERLTGGDRVLELAVPDYRSLIAALEERYPGIRGAIEKDFAVVIDGDIINDPLLEPIPPEAEIHFLHRIGGG